MCVYTSKKLSDYKTFVDKVNPQDSNEAASQDTNGDFFTQEPPTRDDGDNGIDIGINCSLCSR